MAAVPYEALGVPPETAAWVSPPDLGPLGLSFLVVNYVMGREGDMGAAETLRDLAFGEQGQGHGARRLNDFQTACLARYCGALADRLGLRLVPGEQNGE